MCCLVKGVCTARACARCAYAYIYAKLVSKGATKLVAGAASGPGGRIWPPLIGRASSLSLYIILSGPPPLSPFPPSLLPPSQRGQPGGATRLVGYCCHGNWYAGGCRLMTRQSLRDSLPPPPPSPPSLYLSSSASPPPSSLPPLSCLVLFYLSTSPFPSVLSHFTHDQCRKSLGCCQLALHFCLCPPCLVLFYLSTSPFPSLLSQFYVSHMINVGRFWAVVNLHYIFVFLSSWSKWSWRVK